MLSGLRGVGKTVLLNSLKGQADKRGWLTVAIEASPGDSGSTALRTKLARELLTAARRYNRPSLRERLTGAVGSIGSFSATIGVQGITLGITAREGRADSGQIDLDLEEMVEDVTEALATGGKGFAIFVDEMQDVDDELTAALITVQHISGQRGWPFFVVAAGLPSLPARLSSVRSYAERLFDYHSIGPLEHAAASDALTQPALQMGAHYAPDAVDLLVEAAAGYPYFLQEYGKAIWDLAPGAEFTLDDAAAALELGRAQLDQGFFPARWDRATPAERDYLSAMAADGNLGSRSGDIARRLGKKLTGLLWGWPFFSLATRA